MESNSFIVPFLAKGSGVVNFFGGYALGPDGANASRVRDMIARSGTRLRVLVSGDQIYEDSAVRSPRRSDVDDALKHIWFARRHVSDCETLTVQGLRRAVWRPLESSVPAPMVFGRKLLYTSHFTSCHLVAASRDESEMAARRAVDVVFDHLEDACPALFQPPRLQTEHVNQVWLRVYPATDLTAWVAKGEVRFTDPVHGDHREIVVGREEVWARQPPPIECGRRDGIYYVNPAQP